MTVTRRTLLQIAGTTASVAATAGPGGVAAAAGARDLAVTTGNGPYLIVGDSGIVELCTNYHDAVHQAAHLRHSFGIMTRYMRCTSTLMSQLRGQPNSPWVDVDGLAVTPSEAETRAFELLRRARHPEATRSRLWQHHLAALRDDIDAAALADPQTHWYAQAHDTIQCVVHDRDELDSIDPQWTINPCTAVLAAEMNAYLDGDTDTAPEIDTSLQRHMIVDEVADRMEMDPEFRIAVEQPKEVRLKLQGNRPGTRLRLHESRGWIFPLHDGEQETNGEIQPRHVSAHLAAVLNANGFAMAGFWRDVQGVLYHLDEFADTIPDPMVAGKPVRHQNRHT